MGGFDRRCEYDISHENRFIWRNRCDAWLETKNPGTFLVPAQFMNSIFERADTRVSWFLPLSILPHDI